MDVGDKDEMTNFHQTTALNGHCTTITNLTEFLIFAMKREKLFQVLHIQLYNGCTVNHVTSGSPQVAPMGATYGGYLNSRLIVVNFQF